METFIAKVCLHLVTGTSCVYYTTVNYCGEPLQFLPPSTIPLFNPRAHDWRTEDSMSTTTLIAPSAEVPPKREAEQPLPGNGNGASQTLLPAHSAAEFADMGVERLKAAITSAWNMQLRRAGKELGPMLYWLREKLRAQGSRNDLHDKDRGFSAWVESSLDVARSTAARWADAYAEEEGLTSTQNGGSPNVPKGKGVKRLKRSKGITLWVKEPLREQYRQALKTIKGHFNITDNGEAVVKGLSYAAKTINARPRGKSRSQRTNTKAS